MIDPRAPIQFKSLTPMLQTRAMSEAIAWYTSVLCFSCVGQDGDTWCRLERDGVALMFMNNAHLGEPQASATQYIDVDDVKALHRAIKDKVTVEWGPQRCAYGNLEFAVKDQNGYLLSFGQIVEREEEANG